MIPVLAAINAIDAADKVATGAMDLWRQISASKADAKKETTGASGSFGDVLTSQGVAFGPPGAGHSEGHVGAHVSGHGKSVHVVDKVT